MRDLRIRAGTIELQVREYEQQGPPIIFLHFGGGNLMMWQRAIPYFQDRYHLILIDLRDHGRSDKPQAGNHIDQMAQDVVGVIDALQLSPVFVIGSSLGAEVGLSLAANYPEKVRALVCDGALSSEFGPYGTWEGSENAFKEHVAQTIDGVRSRQQQFFSSVDDFVAARKKAFEALGVWNSDFEAFQAYDAYEITPGQFTRSYQPAAFADYLANYFSCRFENYYCRLQRPVLLLAGEEEFQDERTCLAAQGFSRLASHGELVVVTGWSHPYGWLDDPSEICQIIQSFLQKTKAEA